MWIFAPLVGALNETGFQNPYYQGYRYTGSRILEQRLYSDLVDVTWPQSADLDQLGSIWAVDKNYHIIVNLPSKTHYVPWHAFYHIKAGRKGESGYYDGTYLQSLFNSPMGIAVRKDGIYVADTRNHCLRFLANGQDRTVTLTGHPERPGLVDGDTRRSRLYLPTSIGLSKHDDSVFILDNGNRVRMYLNQIVTTLADGACRTVERHDVANSVVRRDVQCQVSWDIGVTAGAVDAWQYELSCVGHGSTCGPRAHPIINDTQSQYLKSKEDYFASLVANKTDGEGGSTNTATNLA